MENTPSHFIVNVEYEYTGDEIATYIVTWMNKFSGVTSITLYTEKDRMAEIDKLINGQVKGFFNL